MKLITGTGLAAGALLIAGGTPVAALSQSASPQSPLGASLATSAVAGTTHQSSDTDDVDAATTDEPGTTSDDVGEVEATEPEDTTEPADGTEDSGAGSALGQAHAAAMKIWAQCVADAASGPKTEGQPMPPKLACGEKPLGPGQIKHLGSTGTQAADADSSTAAAGDSDTADSDTDESTAPDHATGRGDLGAGHEGAGHRGASHHAPGHHGHHG